RVAKRFRRFRRPLRLTLAWSASALGHALQIRRDFQRVDWASSLRAKRSNPGQGWIAASPSAPRNDGFAFNVGFHLLHARRWTWRKGQPRPKTALPTPTSR